jgi:hypothetical protein
VRLHLCNPAEARLPSPRRRRRAIASGPRAPVGNVSKGRYNGKAAGDCGRCSGSRGNVCLPGRTLTTRTFPRSTRRGRTHEPHVISRKLFSLHASASQPSPSARGAGRVQRIARLRQRRRRPSGWSGAALPDAGGFPD